MVTTREAKPQTVTIAGQEWQVGEPEGGWERRSQAEQVAAQWPVYRRYWDRVPPLTFAAAITSVRPDRSLTQVLTDLGYKDLPVEWTPPPPTPRPEPLSCTDRYAAMNAATLAERERLLRESALATGEPYEPLEATETAGEPEVTPRATGRLQRAAWMLERGLTGKDKGPRPSRTSAGQRAYRERRKKEGRMTGRTDATTT